MVLTSMTLPAQQALRRVMELYSGSTRFLLACNNSTKIIDAIQSRCVVLRYSKLTDEQVLRRVEEVCALECVEKTSDGLDAIVFSADGDMRNALNNLQATVTGFCTVNERNVFKVCDQPHPLFVKDMLLACNTELPRAFRMCEALSTEGYAMADILSTMNRVAKTLDLVPMLKLDILKEIASTMGRSSDGVTTVLQLQGLCSQIFFAWCK